MNSFQSSARWSSNTTIASALAAVLVAGLVVGASGTARAQDVQPASPPRIVLGHSVYELTPEAKSELRSIDSQAGLASGLYIAGAITLAVGGATVLPVYIATIIFPAFWAIPIGVGGVGLALLAIGIGLDVESGSRRERFLRDVQLSFGLNGVSVRGSF